MQRGASDGACAGAWGWRMNRSAAFFEHCYGLCMEDSRYKKGRATCMTLPNGEKWRCGLNLLEQLLSAENCKAQQSSAEKEYSAGLWDWG